jgi:hypothetical protein
MRCNWPGLIPVVLILGAGSLWAEPPGGDPLSAPRSVPAPSVPLWPPPASVSAPVPYHRVSAYAVWQYYGVDRQGYFRPRVVYEPGYGSYYLYNGQPYPWLTTQPLNIRPFSLGTPYRNYMPYARD